MSHKSLLSSVALACASCSTLPLGGSTPSELEQELRSRPLVFSDADLAEIDAIRPQLPTPFKLGIAPPLARVSPDRSSSPSGVWTGDEQDLIRAWGRELEASGRVSQVVFLPSALMGGAAGAGGDFVGRARAAAVRSHVDCVLIVNSLSGVHRSNNALAILDLTLVGAAIFPGHGVHSETVAEGVLIDARNGYVYATGLGAAEAKRSSAALFMDEKVGAVVSSSRLAAIDDMARDLARAVSDPE